MPKHVILCLLDLPLVVGRAAIIGWLTIDGDIKPSSKGSMQVDVPSMVEFCY